MTFTQTRSRLGDRSCWKGLPGVFGPEGGSEPSEPVIDVKTLHAKIGELTLVNDFSSGALGKAGLLPSAKR